MHYVEFGGGLGDVIHQCYITGNYRALDSVEKPTAILIQCHNKFAKEIFLQHPRSHLFEIFEVRYCGYPKFPDGYDDVELKMNLLLEGYRVLPRIAPPAVQDVVFYPRAADKVILDQLPGRFIAFQPFSGTSDRDIPPEISEAIHEYAVRHGIPLVIVGRNYERIGKTSTEEFASSPQVLNFIDKLSVPGSIELVKRSSFFIGGHSCMILVAWLHRIPSYALYPEYHANEYFKPGQVDGCSFGRNNPETRLDLFSGFSIEKVHELLACSV
jgi:ADP-heptose:LPS heptosyltransferase